MHRSINVIITAILLLLSGNAMAVMMDNQIYGHSGYSLDDLDMAIQALQDEVSGKKDRKRLKKARRLDRKVERLVYKLDSAILSGKERKIRKKNRKLNRKENKLLAILADYLPDLDTLLQNDDIFTTNNILLEGEILTPLPGILLTQLELLTVPVGNTVGNTGGSTQGSTITTLGTPSIEEASVPEPPMLALLCLGFAGLFFSGLRRKQLC
ncbi:MAG: PEP-CTERM sorting domain-containing protein [Gammaproteobacteria bacterium]|nr:PEP-CTERM sorting domain-containing protein [Gammaproteobacteria bacterium]MDH3972271.1 PEP-CTERM sorting domain-containing protein [Gammaproteobacteria bacterium]